MIDEAKFKRMDELSAKLNKMADKADQVLLDAEAVLMEHNPGCECSVEITEDAHVAFKRLKGKWRLVIAYNESDEGREDRAWAEAPRIERIYAAQHIHRLIDEIVEEMECQMDNIKESKEEMLQERFSHGAL